MKNIIKKVICIILALSILFGVSFSFSFAREKLTYNKALGLAEQYIKNSLEDERWKDNNPTVTDGVYFYTDDENKPSYIEFQISCDNTPYCGFILVNIDGDDVAVPIASTIGAGPSSALYSKLDNEKNKTTSINNTNNVSISVGSNKIISNKTIKGEIKEEDSTKDTNNAKLYYFSPFDQYIEDVNTKEVLAIDPIEDIDTQLEIYKSNEKINIFKETNPEKYEKITELNNKISQLSTIDKKLEYRQEADNLLETSIVNIEVSKEKLDTKRQELKIGLKNKLEELRTGAKEFKKSEEFKELKEGIKEQILEVPDEAFSMKFLDMGYAAYSNPGTSNTFIPGAGASSTICSGITPCYKQFSTTYNGATCWVGCGPVAGGIIMGYYDRNGKSNLILGNASITNDTTVNVMIREIGTAMLTSCSNGEGSTYRTNIKNAVDYAIGKGYTGSTSNYSGIVSTLTIFSKVKTEISNGKPIIIHANGSAGHFMVGFGYKSTNGTDKIVRLNMGWGNGLIDNLYPKSDIDQNLDSIYYMPGYELNVADAYTTFNIQ